MPRPGWFGPNSLTLTISGLKGGSTVLVTAKARVGAAGTPISLQMRAGDAASDPTSAGGPGGDGLFVDELYGDGAWTSLSVAVEEGPWQAGMATVSLRTPASAGASLEVGEIRIVVDGEPALTLTGHDLARLVA